MAIPALASLVANYLSKDHQFDPLARYSEDYQPFKDSNPDPAALGLVKSYAVGIPGYSVGKNLGKHRDSFAKRNLSADLPADKLSDVAIKRLPFEQRYTHAYQQAAEKAKAGKLSKKQLLSWWGDPDNISLSGLKYRGLTSLMRPFGLATAAFSPYDAISYLGAATASLPDIANAVREARIGGNVALTRPELDKLRATPASKLNKGVSKILANYVGQPDVAPLISGQLGKNTALLRKRLGAGVRAGGRSMLSALAPWLLAVIRSHITE